MANLEVIIKMNTHKQADNQQHSNNSNHIARFILTILTFYSNAVVKNDIKGAIYVFFAQKVCRCITDVIHLPHKIV